MALLVVVLVMWFISAIGAEPLPVPKPPGPGGSCPYVEASERWEQAKMKKLIVAALAALVAAAASVADARDIEPSPEQIREYAFNYMQERQKQGLSDREKANQLASTMWWMEKMVLVCPSFFYVNASRARFHYLLRQGTWAMMFGPGKTATSILTENSARRIAEYNNSVSKKEWCEGVKAFGIKHFSWGRLSEQD